MMIPAGSWRPVSMRSSARAPDGCWPPPSKPRSTRTSKRWPASSSERGRRLVVRNGHAEPRTITTAAGGIEIEAPRVDDRRVDPDTGERLRFRSAIIAPWCRKSPKVAEVLPLMYLHGMSSGDFAPALGRVLRLLGRPVGLGHHAADQAVAGRARHLRPP